MRQKLPPEIARINVGPVWENQTDRFLRLPLTLGLLLVAVVLWASGADSAKLLFLGVPILLLAALAWFGLAGNSKPHYYTVTKSRIIKETGAVRQELAFADISGYRVSRQTISVFRKVDGKAFINFNKLDTGPLGELREWIKAEYPDLSIQAATANEAALRQNPALGPTPELRDKALADGRRVAYGLNIAGALTLPLLYFSELGFWAMLVLVVPALIPVALWRYPHALRLREYKTSPYPTFMLAFWAPLMGLLMHVASPGNQLVFEPLLWPMGLVALVYAGALFLGSRSGTARGESRVKLFLAIVWRGIAYGGVTIFGFNRELDHASATTYQTQVVRKYSTHRKSTSYYLVVNPWGPVRSERNLNVSRQYYSRTEPGDTVPVTLHPGRLGASWFVVPGS